MSKIFVHDPERRDSVKQVDGPAQKKIAELPDHMVGVVRDGVRVARVSRGAGAGVVQRLIGGGNVALGKHQGKDAWIAKKNVRADRTHIALDAAVHAASVRASKGSLGKAHKPETHARPHR